MRHTYYVMTDFGRAYCNDPERVKYFGEANTEEEAREIAMIASKYYQDIMGSVVIYIKEAWTNLPKIDIRL